MKKLLVAMLLLYPLSAVAATYEWTDAAGTVHFTEDLGSVPKKYRKKVKVLGGDESGTPQTTVINEPAAQKPKADEQKGKKLYAGKDEGTWRKEIDAARRELEASQSNLLELKARMSDTSKMTRGEFLTIQNSIKHEAIRNEALRKKLEAVRGEAAAAGVPQQ